MKTKEPFNRCGGSFLEVMMACVVLAVIAIGGGSFVVQSQETLAVHRSRGVALAMANSRLEEVRGTPFGQLTNMVSGNATTWIKRNGTGWQVTTAADHDNFSVDTSLQELRTGLQVTNWPTLGLSKILWVTVQATYNTPDYVALTTLYAP